MVSVSSVSLCLKEDPDRLWAKSIPQGFRAVVCLVDANVNISTHRSTQATDSFFQHLFWRDQTGFRKFQCRKKRGVLRNALLLSLGRNISRWSRNRRTNQKVSNIDQPRTDGRTEKLVLTSPALTAMVIDNGLRFCGRCCDECRIFSFRKTNPLWQYMSV